MAISLDDSQLLRLAADPRTRLFPTLRGSTAIGPVVLLAGLLPLIAIVLSSELNDISAAWALRALDVSAATHVEELLEPGREGLGIALTDQPPFCCWLQSVVSTVLGTQSLKMWFVLPMATACFAIWSLYLLGRRIGGSAFGLIAALVTCSHPIVLQSATQIGPASLGMLLLTLTAWGFLGHLEGPPQLASGRMLGGAMAWGLALLTVGPVAAALAVPMTIHVWLLSGERRSAGSAQASGPRESRLWQMWLGMRSLVLFAATAASFSCWWEFMMLVNHGSRFWQSWWTGLTTLEAHSTHEFWKTWLLHNSLICGWMLVGLFTVIRELRFPTSELMRRRCQFALGWWLTTLVLRLIFETKELSGSVLTESIDAALLVPSALLVAAGVRSLVLRQTAAAVEVLLLVVTLGLTVWRITHRPILGVAGACVGLAFLAVLPAVVARLRHYSERWKERDWKRVLRLAIIVLICLQLAAGFLEFPDPTDDSHSLAEFRKRIAAIPAALRVSVAAIDSVPESLQFVVRSCWPKSRFSIAGGREVQPISEASTTDSASATEELIVEWTRRESLMAAEFTPNRQTTAIGDPLRFRGRRLMIYRVTLRHQ